MADKTKEKEKVEAPADVDEDYEDEIDVPYLTVAVAGLLLFGVMAFITGIYYLNEVWNFTTISKQMYDVLKVVFSLIIIAIAFYGIKENVLTESLFIMLFSISSLVFGLMDYAGSGETVEILNIVIGVAILMTTVVFLIRKEYLMALSSLLIAVGSMLLSSMTGDSGLIAFGMPVMIGGIIALYVAFANLIFTETGDDTLPVV
jgi:hypothetical protein